VLNILLVDDDPDILDVISVPFENEGFKILTALDSNSAIEKAKSNKIDILICDFVIPHEPGKHILKIISSFTAKPIVFAITGFEHIEAHTAYEDDVHAFFRKPISASEIYAATMRFIRLLRPHTEIFKKLSSRETEILSLVIAGLTSKEIAVECMISFRTVEKHRENIMRRLEIRNVIDLIKLLS